MEQSEIESKTKEYLQKNGDGLAKALEMYLSNFSEDDGITLNYACRANNVNPAYIPNFIGECRKMGIKIGLPSLG